MVLGGSAWGITGAFLAVPVVATLTEVFRYVNEQIAEATRVPDPPPSVDASLEGNPGTA